MSGDPHIRHVSEFKETPTGTPSPRTASNHSGNGTDCATCSSSGNYCLTVTGDSNWSRNKDAEEKAQRIKDNKEWERRLWRARQSGRNVPEFPRR